MSESDIAARLVDALAATAAREAGSEIALVSVTIDVVASGDAGSIEATLVRKTRTLVFMNAELRNEAGQRIATASSVHKVLTPSTGSG